MRTADLLPSYCSHPRCGLWAKWVLCIVNDDGSVDQISFCKKHGKQRERQIKAAEVEKVLRKTSV